MGYESILESPSASARPRPVTPPRAAPIGQSLNEQPKGDPFGSFRLNADAAANLIQVGASAPGYVMERPIAAIDTLTGGAAKSAIDQAGDTIRGIPVLGDILSGGAQAVGNVYEGLNRVTRAPVNAGMANALRNTAGMAPTAKVDGITAWLSGAGGLMGDLTVQQLREIAARRGFTNDDIQQMVTGRKGILDFADKNVSDNPLVNLAGSLALDPTNYLTLGIAGAAASGAVKLIPGAAKLASMTGLSKLASGMHGINEAVGISKMRSLGTIAGMQALRSGEVAGVTLNTLSRHLAMMFRGSSDFLSGYRKVAYATTAGQIAAQAIGDSGVLDNTPLGHLYEPLYKAAKAMGENKPLSQGGTWNLWAAINFPIRDDLSSAWSETRKYGLGVGVGKATIRTPILRRMFTAEKDIISELAPGMSIAEGRRYLTGQDGFRSAEGFTDLILHFARSLYAERELPRQSAFSEAVYSTAEFSTKARLLNRQMELGTLNALKNGTITGRDIVQHMRDSFTGARSHELNTDTGRVNPVAGAVSQAFDPKEFVVRWNEWTDRMRELHLRAGFDQTYGLVVGIADGALPKEWLRTAQAILKDVARPDGTIAKADMDKFLEKFPALTVDANDPSNFFARLRHPDSGEVHRDAAIQRLKKLEDDAIPLRDYLYDVEQWEARAERIKQKRGSVLNERGQVDPNRAPDIGSAAVIAPTQRGSVRRAIGLAGETYDDVLERRGDASVQAFEESLAPALDDLGFNVGAATQGVVSVGGRKRTAVSIHISPKDDPSTILLAAALTARHARASHAIAVVSGAEALSAHGLTRNAAHVRIDMGALSKDEADAVLEALTSRFDGQYELNDTAGVAHIFVREGQAEAAQLLQRDIAAIVGDARAKSTTAPAWVQVVNNDSRGAVRSGRTPAADVNASDIFRTHATDIRYVNAPSAFRTAADERAGMVGQARPGFTRGPEHARAGSDGLGGQRSGVAPAGNGRVVASVPDGFIGDPHEVKSLTDHITDEDTSFYHVTTATDKVLAEGLKSRREVGQAGLGGGWNNQAPDKVSITYSAAHAAAIEERMKLAVRAARGEATAEEVLAAFSGPDGYADDGYAMAQALNNGRTERMSDSAWMFEDGSRTFTFDPEDPEAFYAKVEEAFKDRPYTLLQYLDDGISIGTDPDAGIVRVGFTATADEMARIDPAQISTLEVAGKRGTPIQHIPEERELRFDPENVVVVNRASDNLNTLTDDIRAADTTGTQGQVLWLAEKDDELANLMPKLGDDLRGLPPEEWAKVAPMEAELRRYDPTYRLKALPGKRNAPTYYAGQGDAIKDMVAVSQAASDLMYQKVWKPAANFQQALFGRVYTRRLAEDAKQLLYGEILAKTAHLPEDQRPRIKDIDSFLQTLDAAAKNSAVFGAQLYARGDALPPKTINEIANGTWTGRIVGVPKTKSAYLAMQGLPVFRGFSPDALEALGGANSIHKVLDRTGSRFYRDLRERTRGKGQLGALIRTTYGMSRVATATPRHYIRTFYHLFRFTLDPRWHVLNRAEADVLGYAKYGVSRFNGAKSPEAIDNAVRLHGGGMVGGESDLLKDALASGVLDARHLEGYIGRAFKKGRVNSTKDVIRVMAQEDPSIIQALDRFGGTPDEWVNGLEKMMYEFDRKGVEPTVLDEAQKILDEQQLQDLSPLLVRLYERNNQVFRDAVSTFHGNTNRSNLERIMNSYFLFWPISYQLKATKWLFDVLTKQTVGRKTNFLGVWTLDRMYQEHVRKLATDEGYQRMFTDNPALWQFAAMLLPVTPFDMGVSLSRFTRYSLAAGGFIEDKDFTGSPFESALSLLKMGPLYSFELARRMYGQTQDKPKPLVVPLEPAA